MRATLPLRLTAFALSLWIGTAAGACLPELPPPPGWTPPPPPTAEERARSTVNWASDIVYGVVTRDSYNGPARFRIIHVYKGSLRPGAVIEAEPGWGLDPPRCVSIQPAPLPRGTYGVVFFDRTHPQLNFLEDQDLQVMFREGLIQSARGRETARR